MMKTTMAVLAAGLILTACVTPRHGGGEAHWGYTGDIGPAYWGSLDPAFEACAEGKNQSPIDLTGLVEAKLPAIRFNYNAKPASILNNGHTVQINYAPGSTLTVDGQVYMFKQVHFHAPSENLINGISFPMEAHFVHADKNGALAVVAVMYVKGRKNNAIEKFWARMPLNSGEQTALADQVHPLDLMPAGRGYYRFNGSLTTPPCTEGVKWLVMKDAVSVSAQQVQAFERVMRHPNNRPVQPHNARYVLE